MPPTVLHGDCLEHLRAMRTQSVDAIVTDPPYGLADHKPAAVIAALTAWANGDRERVPDGRGFMGRSWDAFVPPPAVWDECLRVLKPGGHMLVFAGTRTVDLMGLSIRLAGFEIRDSITWLYGSGFPKSLDVSKAIDKAAGATRESLGTYQHPDGKPRAWGDHDSKAQGYHEWHGSARDITAPATDAAREWSGWGTALKPASEPIIVARKPFTGTVAANVLAHGTGGLNVDGCRVEGIKDTPTSPRRAAQGVTFGDLSKDPGTGSGWDPNTGRWPANVILDEHAAAELDAQSGITKSQGGSRGGGRTAQSDYRMRDQDVKPGFGDTGGASRFFYCAKAPARERPKVDGVSHPTVKPLTLMRWLVRLVTPPGGTVLDPFAGSGTTIEAALREGVHPVGIELQAEYLPLIADRIGRAAA